MDEHLDPAMFRIALEKEFHTRIRPGITDTEKLKKEFLTIIIRAIDTASVLRRKPLETAE